MQKMTPERKRQRRKIAQAGGLARKEKLSPERRREIARKAVQAREDRKRK